MMPYFAVIGLIGSLAYLVRTPRFAVIGAIALGAVLCSLLGYFAWGHRIHVSPGESLRTTIPLLAVLTMLAAGGVYAYTVVPRPAHGEVALRNVGQDLHVQVHGVAAFVWISVHGTFDRSATGAANYILTVVHDGRSARIEGTFRPQEGRVPVERHPLRPLHGAGDYVLRLENASASVAMPMRVTVHERPFATPLLAALFGLLLAGVVAVDVMLRKRGIETSYAAALLFPMVSALYLQHGPPGDSLPLDLLAALAVGAIGGGLGAEFLSRIVHMVTGK